MLQNSNIMHAFRTIHERETTMDEPHNEQKKRAHITNSNNNCLL